jgi:2-dehydro-3-deoxyphosphooctonate aldolase (KDO 8-P synthase)
MRNGKFKIIAGPCVAESEEMIFKTAGTLARICAGCDVDFYFKASYKKANRTSVHSFTGIGDEKALEIIARAGEKFSVKTLTDIHSPEEAALAAGYVDALQIPAFLCRQTDLLTAAGNTGKSVNIKKGQFMAPSDMTKAADKVRSSGNNDVWFTERGTFFGYHDLVVDFRSLPIMRNIGCPVIYDATHSVQQPSRGDVSGGRPEFIRPLARAAAAVGVDGVFFETHPDPANAKSDAASQLPLDQSEVFINEIMKINALISEK